MKTLGIQIKSNEAVLVVLARKSDGQIVQTEECTKFSIKDHADAEQVKQFRVQINTAIDMIKPDKIVILTRNANAKGRMMPSPISFKLEGIIQLYERKEVEFIWPQTVSAWLKKNEVSIVANHKYQEEALTAAYITLLN